MRILRKGVLVIAPFLAVIPSSLYAQSTFHSYGCGDLHQVITREDPSITNHTFAPGQSLLQARFTLENRMEISIVEYPRDNSQELDFNSTILVKHDREQNAYPLGTLIRGGNVFGGPDIVVLCTSPGSGTVTLAFATFATGASEAFAVLQYSKEFVKVRAFPIVATQGRIVISRSDPGQAQIWSATADDYADLCGACDKHYQVYDCRVGASAIKCTKRPGVVGPLPPDNFMEHRIAIQKARPGH